MNITATISQKDLKRVILKQLLKRYLNVKRIVTLATLLLFIAIQFDIKFMLYGLIIYNLYFYFRYLLSIKRSKKLIDTNKSEVTFSFSDTNEGINLYAEQGGKRINWFLFERVTKIENFICIELLDHSLIIIPDNSLSEEEEYDLIQLINAGILKIRGSMNIPLFLKAPYFLGLFCFIPIIGVFVGIVLIFLGIFHYKEKALTFIGILGIVFTIVLYSILFPQLWSKTARDQSLANTSQIFLNDLAKDIETYKLKNGHYPEKLEQLNSSDSIIFIFDPLQSDNKNGSNFNYMLIEDKYKLFSSGIDGIPNTNDDIYPQHDDTIQKFNLKK